MAETDILPGDIVPVVSQGGSSAPAFSQGSEEGFDFSQAIPEESEPDITGDSASMSSSEEDLVLFGPMSKQDLCWQAAMHRSGGFTTTKHPKA